MDMPAEIDFTGGVRGKYSPARRQALQFRRALERIRDTDAVEEHPLEAARSMQDEARRALDQAPA